MAATIGLADYLLTRLRQLGVESIHGVPGDYNLALLDYVEDSGIHFVGNCNELNAGYAADAYGRVKGLGALITTFGVGELSAANAIAGAYAEFAPVVHIVGTPARQLQDSQARIHHTFNDGNFVRFAQMHSHITVAQASLWDPRTCPLMIDSTLQQCLLHSRPVYIQLPADMVSVPVSAERLQNRIEIPSQVSSSEEEKALQCILDRMNSCQRPMILVDGESKAYGILDELSELVKSTNWPTWTTTFGKSLIDETLSNVHGVWKGDSAKTEDSDYIKSTDLILCFGPHFTNTNTYSYTAIPEASKTIFFSSTSVKDQEQVFRDVPAKRLLSLLLKKLDASKMEKSVKHGLFNGVPSTNGQKAAEGPITQDQFYHTLTPFFKSGDIILAETGTAGHGCRDFKLPPNTHLFKPTTWLSIGYMLPATQGASLAQRELHALQNWHSNHAQHTPRTILLIGDGSFQMTVQELSTIIKERLNVVIILINNDGYTIERCLHGYARKYNDVASWRYLRAPAFFGGGEDKQSEYPIHTFTAKTWGELQSVLEDDKLVNSEGLKMVEVFMDKEDAPSTLLPLLLRQKDVPNGTPK